jgi:uncharacterized protein YecT (DUF1311 family)
MPVQSLDRACFTMRYLAVRSIVMTIIRLSLAASIPAVLLAAPPSHPVITPADHADQDRMRTMWGTITANTDPNFWRRLRLEKHISDLCSHYWVIALPVDPPPTTTELDAFNNDRDRKPCNSEDLYVGEADFDSRGVATVRPDTAAARKCAVLHAAAYPMFQMDFEGDRMLAILSANGDGVLQSWPTAMHYACKGLTWSMDEQTQARITSGNGRPGELPSGNFGLVIAMEDAILGHDRPEGFDGCAHPFDDQELNVQEVEECRSFRLRRARGLVAANYRDAKADDPDMPEYGTPPIVPASAFNNLLEQDTLALNAMTVSIPFISANGSTERKQYDLVNGELSVKSYPKLSAGDLSAADARLNHFYQEVDCWLRCRLGAAIGQAFQDAERSWLIYRNAIVAEAIAQAPVAGASSVRTAMLAQLTQQRVETLSRWVDDLQPAAITTNVQEPMAP